MSLQVLVSVVVLGCAVAASTDARAAAATADGLVSLSVPGFGDAAVSPPRRMLGPEPVVIAAHGHGTDPEGICREWRTVVGDGGFVLCPRGVALPQGGYGFDARFAAEVDADVAALRARYGLWVALGPMIYSGYSQGAYEAPAFVMRNPALYPRVLLVEGGQGGWNARRFAAAGGQRVLFACGQASCDAGARASAAAFEKAGVPSKVVYSAGAGHVFWGPISAGIRDQWTWFVAGDLRWTPVPWWRGAPGFADARAQR
jgi:predicted esterase